MSGFAELCVTTNFSFLRAGSHPEVVETALALGLAGIGVADRNTLAGVVRAHVKAKRCARRGKAISASLSAAGWCFAMERLTCWPIRRIARLTPILRAPQHRQSARAEECWLDFGDLIAHSEGLCCIVISPDAAPRMRLILSLPRCVKRAGGLAAAPFRFDARIAGVFACEGMRRRNRGAPHRHDGALMHDPRGVRCLMSSPAFARRKN